ncbi:hypothetical protein TKK_0008785 [Trichogramma kaykai]
MVPKDKKQHDPAQVKGDCREKASTESDVALEMVYGKLAIVESYLDEIVTQVNRMGDNTHFIWEKLKGMEQTVEYTLELVESVN